MKSKFGSNSTENFLKNSKRKKVIILTIASIFVVLSFAVVNALDYKPIKAITNNNKNSLNNDNSNNTTVNEQSGVFKPTSILLYSIQNQLNHSSAPNELPDYEAGNVGSTTLVSYDEWMKMGGHQPWRRDPFLLVRVVTSNLVPENISPQKDLVDSEGNWTESGNKATNIDGVIIKLISPKDYSLDNPSGATTLTYKLIVPHLGSYEVTDSKPKGSAFFIITRIIFNPNSFN